jgi:predicted MPP superfamily phosphohydrolase
VQLTRDQQSLYFAGLDDYMWGRPNQTRAYDGLPRDACVLMLAHNPDIIQTISDPRIRLTCCGHTHGGQINLPLYGPPIKPFGYKSDYIAGMYDTPTAAKVYVSRGLGTILPPLRFNSPPEVTLITLEG